MNIIEWLKSYLKNPKSKESQQAPDEVCPMCWGYQQYQGEFVRDMKINHIDLNNIDEKKGWIEAYVAEKLRGIMLEKRESEGHCPSCGNDAKL
jgi:rubrerythrin